MPQPRVCVLRAPGTNCDVETAYAFELAGGLPERVHLFRLLEEPTTLDQFQVLCIPGGFSYGDDLGAGVVFGAQLRVRLFDAVARFLAADKLVLGICNGFQTLVKAGILPDGAAGWKDSSRAGATTTTLTWNDNGKYTARWVHLKCPASASVFLRDIDEIDLPMAHAEGRLLVSNRTVVDQWRERGQVAAQYAPWPDQSGRPHPLNERWLANPNGAVDDIAALCDATGRVLGLMPHPERFLFATQHPHWTRLNLRGAGAGQQLFANAVSYFSSRALAR